MVTNKSHTFTPLLDKDSLSKKIILPHCKKLFCPNDNKTTLFISASIIYENTLLHFLNLENKKKTYKYSPKFYQLIGDVTGFDGFPQKYISWLNRVRWKGNKERHWYLDDVDEVDLFLMRLEVYSYLVWFYRDFLKEKPLEIIENWYSSLTNKINLPTGKGMPTTKVGQVLSPKKGDNEEIKKLKEIISHQKEIIDGLLKEEKKDWIVNK